jgi:hypothetical protein
VGRHRTFKIIAYSGLIIVILLIALVRRWGLGSVRSQDEDLEQIVQLSNYASLRVSGASGDPDYQWKLSYRPEPRFKGGAWSRGPWEEVGWWIQSGGDVTACPLGNVVVVALSDGRWVFIRVASRAHAQM